jgi:DNA polymerase IIIc chi subunit
MALNRHLWRVAGQDLVPHESVGVQMVAVVE